MHLYMRCSSVTVAAMIFDTSTIDIPTHCYCHCQGSLLLNQCCLACGAFHRRTINPATKLLLYWLVVLHFRNDGFDCSIVTVIMPSMAIAGIVDCSCAIYFRNDASSMHAPCRRIQTWRTRRSRLRLLRRTRCIVEGFR